MKRWATRVVAVVLVLTASLALAYLLRDGQDGPDGDQPLPPLASTFDGPSTDLRRTVVVPTLDTPLPGGSSAVWCGSFLLAWDEFQSVAGGPVQVAGAEDVVGRLNAAHSPRGDLDRGSYYAAAGRLRDGIAQKVRADMAEHFPGVAVPDLGAGDGALAYAYLQAAVRFPVEYRDGRVTFRDAAGTKTAVRAFGLRERDADKAREARDQVGVMFADDPEDPSEFAVDLCRNAASDQVVVACIPRRPTLGEAVADVERRARERGEPHPLGLIDRLLVPAMAWRVDHRFPELEGRQLQGGRLGNLLITRASQVVQFRLDRSGAELASEAVFQVKSALPVTYRFDRPYLVYLRRRGAERPYFAMWVDNAELLAGWEP